MPGTHYQSRRSATNAALANSPTSSEETVSLPQTAFQRLRQRFQADDQETVSNVAESETAETDQPGFFRRMRLPFSGQETTQTATTQPATTQPASDNGRRFALFNSDSDASAANSTPVANVAGNSTTRDPFAVTAAAPPVQAASAQEEEPKETRFAALRRLFRTEDDSATITK
jgi:hypothetical protein